MNEYKAENELDEINEVKYRKNRNEKLKWKETGMFKQNKK